jgi:hypothetical protein
MGHAALFANAHSAEGIDFAGLLSDVSTSGTLTM